MRLLPQQILDTYNTFTNLSESFGVDDDSLCRAPRLCPHCGDDFKEYLIESDAHLDFEAAVGVKFTEPMMKSIFNVGRTNYQLPDDCDKLLALQLSTILALDESLLRENILTGQRQKIMRDFIGIMESNRWYI